LLSWIGDEALEFGAVIDMSLGNQEECYATVWVRQAGGISTDPAAGCMRKR
jgi:hypothetical protein